MGSVGNNGSVSQKDIEDVKNAPFYYRNPNRKAPVADDFMYAFKYNSPLPTHDGKTDIIDFAAEDEHNKKDIANQFVKELEQIVQAKDADAFAGLFLNSGKFPRVWTEPLSWLTYKYLICWQVFGEISLYSHGTIVLSTRPQKSRRLRPTCSLVPRPRTINS